MYAHVTTFQGTPERIAEGIRQFEAQIGLVARRQPGFRGAFVLVDPQRQSQCQSEHAIAIALWHTLEDLSAGEALAAPLGTRGADTADAAAAPVGRAYEVAVAPPTVTGLTPAALMLAGR
jgi:heme-degrading monooxygenase HmoA